MVMIADFAGCWLVEVICKAVFADLEPKAMITRGRERRDKRRTLEAEAAQSEIEEKKAQ